MATVDAALQNIEQLVFANALPAEQAFDAVDYNALLDARDADEFSIPWADAWDLATKAFDASTTNQKIKERLDSVREHIFKRIYNLTQNSDLASYISDDFDLIIKCLATNTQNAWVNALWLTYKEGGIPSSNLVQVPGDLTSIIEQKD